MKQSMAIVFPPLTNDTDSSETEYAPISIKLQRMVDEFSQRFRIGCPGHAALRDDSRNVLRRGHVECGIADAYAFGGNLLAREVRHFSRSPLLNRNPAAVRRR